MSPFFDNYQHRVDKVKYSARLLSVITLSNDLRLSPTARVVNVILECNDYHNKLVE